MEKLFTIQPDFYHGVYTGLSEDNLQMFAADGKGDVFVMVYFNDSGKMLRYEELPLLDIHYESTNSPQKNDELEELATIAALKIAGLIKIQPIRVKKFFVPGHWIGISQYDSGDQRFLDKPEWTPEETAQFLPSHIHRSFHETLADYSEKENADDREMFEAWKARGDFVLYSGNDFWCFSNGDIHSS
jgi:hypothetical protein